MNVIDRGIPAGPQLSVEDLRALALEVSPRRTAEPIGIYQQRLDRNTHLLRSAGVTPGNPLNRYLTRLFPFTAPTDRPAALRHAAKETLNRLAA